jgi:hypothetical protein
LLGVVAAVAVLTQALEAAAVAGAQADSALVPHLLSLLVSHTPSLLVLAELAELLEPLRAVPVTALRSALLHLPVVD